MRIYTILVIALVAGCSGEAAEEPLDYAAMNEAAEGPSIPILPDAIGPEIIADNNLSDAGCYVRAGNGEDIIFIARFEDAHFMLDGQLHTMAPHPGERTLPYGAGTHYDGLEFSSEITIDQDSELQTGPETSEYSGQLVIRDSKDRPVFEHLGTIICGA